MLTTFCHAFKPQLGANTPRAALEYVPFLASLATASSIVTFRD